LDKFLPARIFKAFPYMEACLIQMWQASFCHFHQRIFFCNLKKGCGIVDQITLSPIEGFYSSIPNYPGK
jgi:hypothetical protein